MDFDKAFSGLKEARENITSGQMILSALAMMSKLVETINIRLREWYPGVVFAKKDAWAYVSDSGEVDKVEILFSIHGAGIKPYKEAFVLARGK